MLPRASSDERPTRKIQRTHTAILEAAFEIRPTRESLGLRLGHGFIEAAAINIGDFSAHGPEIGDELAAMVNCVEQHELEIEYSRVIIDAEEGYRGRPEFG